MLVLSRALALEEWAPKVRVNHITTGLVRTEAGASVYGDDGGAAVAAVIPMGRMARPDDIADACLYLSGDLTARDRRRLAEWENTRRRRGRGVSLPAKTYSGPNSARFRRPSQVPNEQWRSNDKQ